MNIKKYVYHLTHKNNLNSILDDMALKSDSETIYVCPTKTDIAKFAPYIIRTNPSDYVLFKIDTLCTNPKLWEISNDHNRRFIDANAFVYYSSVLPLSKNFEIEIFDL